MKTIKYLYFTYISFLASLFVFFYPLSASAGMFGGGGKDIASLNRYAQSVLDALLMVTGPIALLAIIYGGIMYMLSAGDEKKAQTAKRIIMYALIGVAVIVGSYFLITLVSNFFV